MSLSSFWHRRVFSELNFNSYCATDTLLLILYSYLSTDTLLIFYYYHTSSGILVCHSWAFDADVCSQRWISKVAVVDYCRVRWTLCRHYIDACRLSAELYNDLLDAVFTEDHRDFFASLVVEVVHELASNTKSWSRKSLWDNLIVSLFIDSHSKLVVGSKDHRVDGVSSRTGQHHGSSGVMWTVCRLSVTCWVLSVICFSGECQRHPLPHYYDTMYRYEWIKERALTQRDQCSYLWSARDLSQVQEAKFRVPSGAHNLRSCCWRLEGRSKYPLHFLRANANPNQMDLWVVITPTH